MDQISQIKQQLDIASIVGTYVSLKKSGKNYRGLCPFHSENSPSFMVSPELGIFKCFGCNKAGDIFTFIQEIEGVDFGAALEQLAEKAGIKLEKQKLDPDAKLKKQLYWINDQAAKFFNHILTGHALGKPGLEYVKKSRKLCDATISDFTIGYAPDVDDALFGYFSKKGVEASLLLSAGLVIHKDSGGYMDKFRGRIMIPLKGVDGKVLGFTGRVIFDRQPKYLNTSETSIFYKSMVVYGLDKAKAAVKKQGVVLVEGNMDVIKAHEAGFANVVAASGTSLTIGQLKAISRYTNDLTFCFDTDSAGVAASFRGIELAENLDFNIKVAIIPLGFKDLDELIGKNKDAAAEMLQKAVPAYDFLLFSVMKKHNKNSPDGKKKIMDEIAPWFSKIKNKVLFDHYCKEIARELELNEDTVVDSLNYAKTAALSPDSYQAKTKQLEVAQLSVESYIISVLLKTGLDFMRLSAYKLEPEDFSDEKSAFLLGKIKEFIEGLPKKTKKFDPQKFQELLDDQTKKQFGDLYLYQADVTPEQDTSLLEKEFEQVLVRLKKESAKRQMHKISNDMRLAEKSSDFTAVKKLTKQFELLKKQLL